MRTVAALVLVACLTACAQMVRGGTDNGNGAASAVTDRGTWSPARVGGQPVEAYRGAGHHTYGSGWTY